MRLLAVALACVFAVTPIAAEVCETSCVDHVDHSDGLGSGSHHHHGSSTIEHAEHTVATQKSASASGTLATSVSHDCCFSVAVLTDSPNSNRGAGVSSPMATPSTGATAVAASQRATVNQKDRPRGLVRPPSQLRV
jgi:hypothetical protein